jgi:hypothetical protein
VTLTPRAWRTLYNVADALRPGPDEGAVDLAPAVEAALGDGRPAQRLERTLAWLELETRLLRSPSRGFCWLSREERWERLAVWERSRLPWRRHAFLRLAEAVDAALARSGVEAEPMSSVPGATPARQSRPGA